MDDLDVRDFAMEGAHRISLQLTDRTCIGSYSYPSCLFFPTNLLTNANWVPLVPQYVYRASRNKMTYASVSGCDPNLSNGVQNTRCMHGMMN